MTQEKDFILTPYIAEVINTITNLTYSLYPSSLPHLGASSFRSSARDVLFSHLLRQGEFLGSFTNAFIVSYAVHGIVKNCCNSYGTADSISRSIPYFGIMLVGIGSAIFHSTNLYYTQWADDLSMLFATATVLHRVYTFDKSPKETILWGGALAGFLIAFSVYHCVMDEVVFHGLIFAAMIVIVGARTRAIIAKTVTDPFVKAEVRKLVWYGTGSFALGYLFWNIDFHGCGHHVSGGGKDTGLTALKRWIGMPLSFLFELHGWWHIFTGIGAYIFIALVEYLTSEEAGDPLGGRFAWPVEAVCLKKDGRRGERGTTGKLNPPAATSGREGKEGRGKVRNGHVSQRMKLT